MSDRDKHDDDAKAKHHHNQDDRDEAVIAADDTGMVSNEANIIQVETEEGLDR
jgi:hypothetical protein